MLEQQQLFTAKDAKDAKDCLDEHRDERLRHAIQNPVGELIGRKRPTRPDPIATRTDGGGGPLKRGTDLATHGRQEAVPFSITARCAAACPMIEQIRPIRCFRPFPFTPSVLDG